MNNLTEEIKKEILKDVDFLLENPDKTLSAKYHDAGSCWELIDCLLCLIEYQNRFIEKLKIGCIYGEKEN